MVPPYLLYPGIPRPKTTGADSGAGPPKAFDAARCCSVGMPRWDRDRIRNAAGLGIVTVLVVVLLILAAAGFPPPFPVPRGTVFSRADLRSWVVNFDVPASGGRIVGAWTAYNVSFPPSLMVTNGTLASPPISVCPLFVVSIPLLNGTVNRSVMAGPHALYWLSCSQAARIVVTEPIFLL